MNWIVLKVKSNSERKVADTLERMKIEVYCPMTKETRFWSDRKKTVEVPIFKNHVFVKLEDKYRGIVFGVSGVERYLFWLGRLAIVREHEIETIKDWQNDESNTIETLYKLIPGNEITIAKGLLKNQEGIVQLVDNNNLSLLLKEIGYTVQIKLANVVAV
jgi:transcription antitermination factor NusG